MDHQAGHRRLDGAGRGVARGQGAHLVQELVHRRMIGSRQASRKRDRPAAAPAARIGQEFEAIGRAAAGGRSPDCQPKGGVPPDRI